MPQPPKPTNAKDVNESISKHSVGTHDSVTKKEHEPNATPRRLDRDMLIKSIGPNTKLTPTPKPPTRK